MGCAASRYDAPRGKAFVWRPEPERDDAHVITEQKHCNEFRPVIRAPDEGEKAGGTKGAEIRRVFGI